jgi:hypothetical protein
MPDFLQPVARSQSINPPFVAEDVRLPEATHRTSDALYTRAPEVSNEQLPSQNDSIALQRLYQVQS